MKRIYLRALSRVQKRDVKNALTPLYVDQSGLILDLLATVPDSFGAGAVGYI
jgi:hypothetical protein